jgi:hypothetical protein
MVSVVRVNLAVRSVLRGGFSRDVVRPASVRPHALGGHAEEDAGSSSLTSIRSASPHSRSSE